MYIGLYGLGLERSRWTQRFLNRDRQVGGYIVEDDGEQKLQNTEATWVDDCTDAGCETLVGSVRGVSRKLNAAAALRRADGLSSLEIQLHGPVQLSSPQPNVLPTVSVVISCSRRPSTMCSSERSVYCVL